MTRRIAIALGMLTMAFSALYVFVYLYRWEWNRALFCLGLFVATEVALGVAMVVSRLTRLEGRIAALRDVDPVVLGRVREAAPPARKPFAWLVEEEGRTAVFVPILMGAGIVLSGVAWLVERLASRTAGAALERGLAARLSALSLPDRLVPADTADSLFQPLA